MRARPIAPRMRAMTFGLLMSCSAVALTPSTSHASPTVPTIPTFGCEVTATNGGFHECEFTSVSGDACTIPPSAVPPNVYEGYGCNGQVGSSVPAGDTNGNAIDVLTPDNGLVAQCTRDGGPCAIAFDDAGGRTLECALDLNSGPAWAICGQWN